MVKTDGFARHASGLLVPDEHRREREVWLRSDWRTVDRATKFLESRGLQLYFGCPEPGCQGAPIERMRNLDGGITLRCNHRDRVIPKELR